MFFINLANHHTLKSEAMDKLDLSVRKCYSNIEIKREIKEELSQRARSLPQNRDAKIFIKPNLNSNMNALTGNTTDLRLIAAVLEFLKNAGYSNITIGEGTNSGFYRRGIGVISRLKVDELTKRYGAKICDLNYEKTVEIEFENGVKADIAAICVNSDFFINMPKLKMHYETVMSVCLKSLVGCLVGMENKKKTHANLIKNIYNLNRYIKPNLHIIDAIIAMEGTGPTTGTPIHCGYIITGENPFLLDLACARIAKVPYFEVPLLKLAEEEGDITRSFHEYLDTIDINRFSTRFKRPEINWLTAIVSHKRLQKYFLKVRHAPLVKTVFGTPLANRIMFTLGLTQEIFNEEERDENRLHLNMSMCKGEGKCRTFCPVGLSLPDEVNHDECINCLYCFSVCPNRAIEIEGSLGFFYEQIKQYDAIIRRL